MPPDYETQAFWDNRFKEERHFEWLGDGKETIIPVLRPVLQAAALSHPNRIPRLLHIGAGSSSLSDHILGLYQEVFGERLVEDLVINTDFAGQAVERGNAAERATGRVGVRWEQADLLKWEEVAELQQRCRPPQGTVPRIENEMAVFDFVADKSTSDAISCGEFMTLTADELTTNTTVIPAHPLLRTDPSTPPLLTIQIEPLELLALHLATLVRPGGLWVALSYSSNRFPFLVHPKEEERRGWESEVNLRPYWDVVDVRTANAPSGWGRLGGEEGEGVSVHTPQIMHYLYTFRRTDTLMR